MKGNKNGYPMSVKQEKYFGPTVGEKLEIYRQQCVLYKAAVEEMLATDNVYQAANIGLGVLRKVKKLEKSWK